MFRSGSPSDNREDSSSSASSSLQFDESMANFEAATPVMGSLPVGTKPSETPSSKKRRNSASSTQDTIPASLAVETTQASAPLPKKSKKEIDGLSSIKSIDLLTALNTLQLNDNQRKVYVAEHFVKYIYVRDLDGFTKDFEVYVNYWLERRAYNARSIHISIEPFFTFSRGGLADRLRAPLTVEKNKKAHKLPLGYSMIAFLMENCVNDIEGQKFLKALIQRLVEINGQAATPTSARETYQRLLNSSSFSLQGQTLSQVFHFFDGLFKAIPHVHVFGDPFVSNPTPPAMGLDGYLQFYIPYREDGGPPLANLELIKPYLKKGAVRETKSLLPLILNSQWALLETALACLVHELGVEKVAKSLSGTLADFFGDPNLSHLSDAINLDQILQTFSIIAKFKKATPPIDLLPTNNSNLLIYLLNGIRELKGTPEFIARMPTNSDTQERISFIRHLLSFSSITNVDALTIIIEVITHYILLYQGNNFDPHLFQSYLEIYSEIRNKLNQASLLPAKPIGGGKKISELEALTKGVLENIYSKSPNFSAAQLAISVLMQSNPMAEGFVDSLQKIMEYLGQLNYKTGVASISVSLFNFQFEKAKSLLQAFRSVSTPTPVDYNSFAKQILALSQFDGHKKLLLLETLALNVNAEFYFEAATIHLDSLAKRSFKDNPNPISGLSDTGRYQLLDDQQDIVLMDYFLKRLSEHHNTQPLIKDIFLKMLRYSVNNPTLLKNHLNYYSQNPRFSLDFASAMREHQLEVQQQSAELELARTPVAYSALPVFQASPHTPVRKRDGAAEASAFSSPMTPSSIATSFLDPASPTPSYVSPHKPVPAAASPSYTLTPVRQRNTLPIPPTLYASASAPTPKPPRKVADQSSASGLQLNCSEAASSLVKKYLPEDNNLRELKESSVYLEIRELLRDRCDDVIQQSLREEILAFQQNNPTMSFEKCLPYLENINSKYLKTIPANSFKIKNPRNAWCWDIPTIAANRWLEETFPKILDYNDPNSNVTLMTLLVSVWIAIHDAEVFNEEQQKALVDQFISTLTFLQQANNAAYDDKKHDYPACDKDTFTNLLFIIDKQHPTVNLSTMSNQYLTQLVVEYYENIFTHLSEAEKIKISKDINTHIPKSFFDRYSQGFLNTRTNDITNKYVSVQQILDLLAKPMPITLFPKISAFQAARPAEVSVPSIGTFDPDLFFNASLGSDEPTGPGPTKIEPELTPAPALPKLEPLAPVRFGRRLSFGMFASSPASSSTFAASAFSPSPFAASSPSQGQSSLETEVLSPPRLP